MIKNDFDLGLLAENHSFHENLVLGLSDRATLIKSMRNMMLIRAVECKLAEGRRDGLIGGPVHLSVGQEAVAVGVSKWVRNTDMVFGAHRSHSHLLALGSNIRKLFAEVLGKKTGLSRGMGGSMHLWDGSVGFYGSVPIVSGTVPLAVGAAMASRLKGTGDIAVAYFGDGACEEGVVHESLNLSSINREPILFVVENNLFASHMHISTRQPKTSTARFADAHSIQYAVVDGNNVVAVSETAEKMIQSAREGRGPCFIEAVTYRWYGHVDWREDVDVGVNRSKEDIEKWRKKDPIRRLKDGLIDNGSWAETEHQSLQSGINAEVEAAWNQACQDPCPSKSEIMRQVFAT